MTGYSLSFYANMHLLNIDLDINIMSSQVESSGSYHQPKPEIVK